MGCASSDENHEFDTSPPIRRNNRSVSLKREHARREPISRTPPTSLNRHPLKRSESTHRRSITHSGVECKVTYESFVVESTGQVVNLPVLVERIRRGVERLDVPSTSHLKKPKKEKESTGCISQDEIDKWKQEQLKLHAKYNSNKWKERQQKNTQRVFSSIN